MAQDKGKVRFIRVNGRIVPIKDKDPSKSQIKKNYKKYGDGARQAERIEDKYQAKAEKTAKKRGGNPYVAASVLGLGYLARRGFVGKLAIGAGIGGLGRYQYELSKANKKNTKSKEREYVRTFGMTSDGQIPKKNRSGVK